MTGWFAQNTDCLALLAMVAALWIGLTIWLRRTGRLGSLPRITWVLLLVLAGAGWPAVTRAGRPEQNNVRPEQRVVMFSGYSAQDAQQRFAGQKLDGSSRSRSAPMRFARS